MIRGCRGAEKVFAVYWFAILLIVAGAIVYMVVVFYGRPYDVREIESRILTNQIANCLAEGGYLNEEILGEDFKNNFLERCNLNFDVKDISDGKEQYYAGVNVYEFGGDLPGQLVFDVVAGNVNLKPVFFKEVKRKIDTIVIHYTACSLEAAVSAFKRGIEKNEKSIHYVIDRDGTIYSKENAGSVVEGGEKGFVDESEVAWHAGCENDRPFCHDYEEKPYEGEDCCRRKVADDSGKFIEDFNTRSIGIELVNLGYACEGNEECRANGIELEWFFSGVESEEEGFCGKDVRIWERYTGEQIDALSGLVAEIAARHDILINRDRIIGHDDIDPCRKKDPGPDFPWKKFIEDVKLKEKTTGGRNFYAVDRNNNQYVIKILTSVGKEEKNE